jgi:hypothetical protein
VTDIQVTERPSDDERCVYCRDALAAGAVLRCPACQVGVHAECRGGLKRCPTVGCAGFEAVPVPPPAPQVIRRGTTIVTPPPPRERPVTVASRRRRAPPRPRRTPVQDKVFSDVALVVGAMVLVVIGIFGLKALLQAEPLAGLPLLALALLAGLSRGRGAP